jgi:hypothetical protein
VARYLLIVYGLGGAWLWWLIQARGEIRSWGGLALLGLTALLYVMVIRRGRRLASPWERVPSRLITHAFPESRWNRRASTHPEDPGDIESHVGGWS